jgi:hypothetical protein
MKGTTKSCPSFQNLQVAINGTWELSSHVPFSPDLAMFNAIAVPIYPIINKEEPCPKTAYAC